jgi:probable rRNA maturation factor
MSRRPTQIKKVSRRKPAADSAVKVHVSGVSGALAGRIRRAALATFVGEDRRGGRLEVAIVDDSEMRKLHRRWMGLGSTTDVLTFDLSDGGDDGLVDAQLVVCKPVAVRRSAETGGDWRLELLLYVVHGCLHLCGYDDVTSSKAARMHRREDEILLELGLGAVYSQGEKMRSSRTTSARKRTR